jgi:regulator of cell morphogenesis and NO signaling
MIETTNLETSLAELAVQNAAASRVFHRHGLDYCCGGRRPLVEACAERGLDPSAVLAEVAAAGAGSTPAERWHERPLDELMTHIVDFFHVRLRAELPELAALARKVEARHADKASCPRGLTAHVETIGAELFPHMMKEEQILFPALRAGWGPRALGPIRVMEAEHRDAALQLERTRELTADLVAPGEACTSWRALYLRLDAFEAELMEHIHLENNVLFARAMAA